MRIKSLDAVRGIAALVVVISHCIGTVREPPRWVYHFPATLLYAGDGAVFVFFALSGCVLFLSLCEKRRLAYFGYLTKRFFRIYPTFMVAVAGSAVLFELVQPHAVVGVSDWFNHHWLVPPTGRVLFGHFAMTDLPDLQALDTVMWSLVHEVRISIVFPLIALGVLTNWRAAVIVSIVISVCCTYAADQYHINLAFNVIRTLSFLFLFSAGAAIAYHADAVRRALTRCPVWFQVGLWVVALRLITFPAETGLGLVTGAAALLLIALAFGTPLSDRVLSTNPVLTWLGRISYSLYLVHFPVIMTFVHVFHGRLSLMAIFVLAVAASLAVAELMNRLVEQPSIALGRRLAALSALRWEVPLRGSIVRSDP